MRIVKSITAHTKKGGFLAPPGERFAVRRSGFSLVELMIGIVILGLGLVMVATMFPIAWGRARDLADRTRGASITRAADTTLRMLARTDGVDYDAATFCGDMIYSTTPLLGGQEYIIAHADTRVQYLNMENIHVAPRAIVPPRELPWRYPAAPWRLSRLAFTDSGQVQFYALDLNELLEHCDNQAPPPDDCQATFLAARMRLGDRVYPPIREPMNIDDDGVFDDTMPDQPWNDLFDSRRYVLGIFTRLRELIGPLYLSGQQVAAAQEAADNARKFDVYYVTLRRPNPNKRYAVQDPATAPNPFRLEADPMNTPLPRPGEEDVLLPEPWRVQIQFNGTIPTADPDDDDANPDLAALGTPAEVQVPPNDINADGRTQAMLANMFQRGTPMIDELTGTIWRVNGKRLNDEGTQATLTLDQEVVQEDLDITMDSMFFEACNNNTCVDGQLDGAERLRTVWIYPPGVEGGRTQQQGDLLVFDGPHPVVDIVMQTMELTSGQ